MIAWRAGKKSCRAPSSTRRSKWTSGPSCAPTNSAIPAQCIPVAVAATFLWSRTGRCRELSRSTSGFPRYETAAEHQSKYPRPSRLNDMSNAIVVTGAFDDLRSRHMRFLEEAAKLGEVTVLLWPDQAVQKLTGKPPMFPEAERLYLLKAVRYVSRVLPVAGAVEPDELPD